MEFKKRVEVLLKEKDRSLAWLGRQINKTPQAMQSSLITNDPKIGLVYDISNVFDITIDEFYSPKSEQKGK